jgi:hypothetical protein
MQNDEKGLGDVGEKHGSFTQHRLWSVILSTRPGTSLKQPPLMRKPRGCTGQTPSDRRLFAARS